MKHTKIQLYNGGGGGGGGALNILTVYVITLKRSVIDVELS